jgi:hypothetical protein
MEPARQVTELQKSPVIQYSRAQDSAQSDVSAAYRGYPEDTSIILDNLRSSKIAIGGVTYTWINVPLIPLFALIPVGVPFARTLQMLHLQNQMPSEKTYQPWLYKL